MLTGCEAALPAVPFCRIAGAVLRAGACRLRPRPCPRVPTNSCPDPRAPLRCALRCAQPPYLNPPANNKPGTTKHVTRFIGLAPVGALDKKNRWIYAANITPVANMSAEKLNEIPPGVTHSPFKPPPMAFQSAGGLSTVGAGAAEQGLSKTICHVANLPFNIREDSLLFSFGPPSPARAPQPPARAART